MSNISSRRGREDFTELHEQLKKEWAAGTIPPPLPEPVEERPVNYVSPERRRRSSLMDNRKMRYAVSTVTLEAHDRECPDIQNIPDAFFDMQSAFPQNRWFCEKCYFRALIRNGILQHEMKLTDRYCAIFQKFHADNRDLRRLMLNDDTKLLSFGADYVELSAGGEQWRIYSNNDTCQLYRLVENTPGQARMYRQDWNGEFGKIAFRITDYAKARERNRRLYQQKVLRKQLDDCINIKQLRKFSLFHAFYIYADCIGRYKALFWEHGFTMQIKEILEYPDSGCAIVICRIRKKYRKKLFAAMKEMKEKSIAIGCTEYADFCIQNLPPDSKHVQSIILGKL